MFTCVMRSDNIPETVSENANRSARGSGPEPVFSVALDCARDKKIRPNRLICVLEAKRPSEFQLTITEAENGERRTENNS